MHTKRSLSYAIVALTLPLSLCLPHTLVAAFRIYDYIPSSLGSLRSSGGRSMLVRRADVPESGYYNPSDYGGYMMTVSFCFLPLLCSSTLSGGLLFPDITTRLRVCRGLIADYVVYVGLFRWFPRLRFSCPWFGQYIDTEWTVGLGEPVNAILSAKSDPQIMIDQETDGGLRNYFLYVPFSSIPLGL